MYGPIITAVIEFEPKPYLMSQPTSTLHIQPGQLLAKEGLKALLEDYAPLDSQPASSMYVRPGEAESLLELYQQVLTALEPTGKSFEILFIDDGSRDGSFEIIRRMREGDKRIRAIQFRRNYGKSAALAVAFEAVRGEVVVIPRAGTALRAGDRVVMFVATKAVKEVERLFAVRLEYF